MKKKLPTRSEDYSEWYHSVVKQGDLAEHSPVRGCMVIRPWGCALWDKIKNELGELISEEGVQNVYFPLLIPLSYLEKEAAHVEGFAKECAVVTHHRLALKNGSLEPDGKLEEPFVVRPTSEVIIGEAFSRWIQSYRDLPMMVNQWANIVRWELRTRLFLRTSEFLWQEGHTAHSTEQEASDRAEKMVNLYLDFAKDKLAIPAIMGEKSPLERFPGAVSTYTIEAMMQDGKALQLGTSHFFGQNFSAAQSILFQNKDGDRELAWTTSWGVTTRLIGAITMVHSDDLGLIIPPQIAPIQVVIMPLIEHKPEKGSEILQYSTEIQKLLKSKGVSVHIDNRDMRAGERAWSWTKKGVPIRLEIGPKEIDTLTVSVIERIHGHNAVDVQSRDFLCENIDGQLKDIQTKMYDRALKFTDSKTTWIYDSDNLPKFFKEHTGFVCSYWGGTSDMEAKLQKELGITLRTFPKPFEYGLCPFTGKNLGKKAVFAKAY